MCCYQAKYNNSFAAISDTHTRYPDILRAYLKRQKLTKKIIFLVLDEPNYGRRMLELALMHLENVPYRVYQVLWAS